MASSEPYLNHLGWRIGIVRAGDFARLVRDMLVGLLALLAIGQYGEFSYILDAPLTFETRYGWELYWITLTISIGASSYFLGIVLMRYVLSKAYGLAARKLKSRALRHRKIV